MIKSIIKKIWKKSPIFLHIWIMRLMCYVKIGHKKLTTQLKCSATPLYIIGCFQAGGGLSQSAHLYAEECKKSFSNVICVDSSELVFQNIKNPITNDSIFFLKDILEDTKAATVILHHNPPQFQYILCALGKNFIRNKHIVAYWAWELEDIPTLWKQALNYVDAVEVPSSFTQKAISKYTTKPVKVKPHILPPPKNVKKHYSKDGILRCLFVMDMGSLRVRKNPEAVIRAFTKAFAPHEALLTIKLAQTSNFKSDYKKILLAAKGHSNIHIITHWMDSATLEELYLTHDVYISLHRSEGYGLTIHEAMLKKLIIVATGWSGNMDFMHGENIYAVNYKLVPIAQSYNQIVSLKHGQWAEADIDHAAAILQKIRKHHITSNM